MSDLRKLRSELWERLRSVRNSDDLSKDDPWDRGYIAGVDHAIVVIFELISDVRIAAGEPE